MNTIRSTGLVLLLSALLVPGLSAEDWGSDGPIRAFLKNRKEPVTGRLYSFDDQTLTLVVKGRPVAFDRQDVVRLAVRRKRVSSVSGLAIGIGVGAAAGVVAGLIHGSDPPGIVSFPSSMYAITLGAVGAFAGGVVGGALVPRDRWDAMPWPRTAHSVAPPGAHVAVSVSF